MKEESLIKIILLIQLTKKQSGNYTLVDELKEYLGFAVAGNFANHLGEVDEFSIVKTEEENESKGLFTFYIKNYDSFFELILFLVRLY